MNENPPALVPPLRWGDVASPDGEFLLPVGTVTLLLADVEGSTRRWESDEAAMASASAELSTLVGEIIGRHHGVRPLEQGEGDSFVAAFARPSEAVACALDIQRSASLPLRIAVHAGEAQRTDDGTYVGPALNRAGRLRDAAHGGQVVVSRAAVELVSDRLPKQASLRDLGTHRLKDLSRPERIFQLEHPDLRADFPPLRSLDTYRHNLPQYRDSFVGRRREMDDVRALMAESQLVTLTGAGGSGKTRLGLQVGAGLLDEFANGVFFADLSGVGRGDEVLDAVATSLGVVEDAANVLEPFLSDRTLLLVLDNCEHVVAACAELCDRLLARAPALRVLATSREPLGIPGEATYVVPSLPVPPAGDLTGIEGLAPYAAAELFLDRARRVVAGFVPTDDDAHAIADVCRRLDGIPLAIELAAARVRVLSPRQIADGLGGRFRLLTGGARTALARQQTLKASVDWSYDLLTELERVVFRRMSVFSSDCNFAAAANVCAGPGVETHHVLDLLSLLVDKSLVQVETKGGEARYRMLETIRQYAADRLEEAGETHDCRVRRRDHFVDVAERLGEDYTSPRALDAFDALRRDLDNLESTFRWSCDQEAFDEAARVISSISPFLNSIWIGEPVWWWNAVIPAIDRLSDPVRAAALYGIAREHIIAAGPRLDVSTLAVFTSASLGRARAIGDTQGIARALIAHAVLQPEWMTTDCAALLREAVTLARSAGDHSADAHASRALADRAGFGAAEADPFLEDARAAARSSGSPLLLTEVSYSFANHLRYRGGLRRFLHVHEEVLAALEPHREGHRHALVLRAMALAYCGRFDDARRLAEDVLPDRLDVGDMMCSSNLEWTIGAADAAAGDLDGALAHFSAGRDLAERGAPPSVAPSVWGLVGIHLARGDIALARRLADELVTLEVDYAAMVSYAEGDLERAEQQAHDLLATGIGMFVGWCLELLAAIGADQGRDIEAARLLAAAQVDGDATGDSYRPAFLIHLRDRTIAALRERMDDAEFDDAWKAGAAMDRKTAVAYVRRGRGERGRPSAGWASLTPTEQQVVDLVAQGLGNKEIGERLFISVRTVTTHLTHVYAKLAIASRTELVAEAGRRGRG